MDRKIVVVVLAVAALLGAVILVVRLSGPAPEPVETVESTLPVPATPAPVVRESAEPEVTAEAPVVRPRPAPAPVEPADTRMASPTVGTLYVDADVAGARVFLNRAFVGETPVTVPDLEPGSYQVSVSAQGYDSIARTVDVAPEKVDLRVTFREVRLDARLDVVHGHRFGSCRGRLVATPHGLRYETTNQNDGFEIGLLDLETFEIDYLDGTLRVQAEGGRRFDFSDPEDDADRLFVFHRDVEKARAQLLKGDPPATP